MQASKTAVHQDNDYTRRTASAKAFWTWPATFSVALLMAGAAMLRFLFLARKPFWFDECFSVEVARLPWHDFLRLAWWREANMSLYYLLLREWLHFGGSTFFIRSLSVLCSLATLPAIFWVARKLFDLRVAVIVVALMSFNAYAIRYAQEARSYSLFILLGTLSSGFFIAWLRDPSRRNQWAYVLASVLAVYAHFYALLLIGAHWLSLRAMGTGGDSEARADIRTGARRAWIAIGLAVLPVLAFVGKTGAGLIRWIARPGFHDLRDFFEHLAGNNGWPLLLLYAAACLAAILPVRARLMKRGAGWEVWRLQFLLLWLLFPVGLTLLLSLARPVFLGRYFVFCLPALIILAAAGLANLHSPWMAAVCLAAILLASLQGTFSYYDHDFDLERDGSEAAANYIYARAQSGDAILFHIAEGRVPYEFFGSLRRHESGGRLPQGPEIIFPRHGERLDYRDVTGKPNSEFLRAAALRYPRLWVVLMSNGPPGHPDATTLMLGQVLGGAYPEMESMRFPQVEVRVYARP